MKQKSYQFVVISCVYAILTYGCLLGLIVTQLGQVETVLQRAPPVILLPAPNHKILQIIPL